jgi:hypothetical protein
MSVTHDRLADPDRRSIETVFTTGIRVAENSYDSGVVRVALVTSHDKSSKRIETRLSREVLTDSGFVTRRFVLFGPASADAGIRLATEPIARFNAKKAAALHDFVLTNLALMLTHEDSDVARELADLLAQELVDA